MDETKNPWTVVSEATVYENNWIRLNHHEVLDPSGSPAIYGTVHFKSHATGVVPIDGNGDVFLVGQYRFPLGAYSWEVPEGGGPQDVPFLESAQRELREECGLVAKGWKEILGMDISNSVSDERATVFLAWDLLATAAQPDLWFQLYIQKDEGLTKELVNRAATAGYRVLVITVDTLVTGHRTRDERNGLIIPPALTLQTLGNIAVKPGYWMRMLRSEAIDFANFTGGGAGVTTIEGRSRRWISAPSAA